MTNVAVASCVRRVLAMAAILSGLILVTHAKAEVIQSYTAYDNGGNYSEATLDGAAPGSTPNKNSPVFASTWVSNGSGNLEGQSVYIPVGSGTVSNFSFSFFTGGSSSNAPTLYAPAGSRLYVFTETMTQEQNGGPYTGDPGSLTTSTAGLVGYSAVGNGTAYNFSASAGGSGLTLSAGTLYFFYVGAPDGSPFSFDVSNSTYTPTNGFSNYTPESNSTSLEGDQRYRAPSGTANYGGPTNSMTLFILQTPEPSCLVGLLGIVAISGIGLIVNGARNRALSVC